MFTWKQVSQNLLTYQFDHSVIVGEVHCAGPDYWRPIDLLAQKELTACSTVWDARQAVEVSVSLSPMFKCK